MHGIIDPLKTSIKKPLKSNMPEEARVTCAAFSGQFDRVNVVYWGYLEWTVTSGTHECTYKESARCLLNWRWYGTRKNDTEKSRFICPPLYIVALYVIRNTCKFYRYVTYLLGSIRILVCCRTYVTTCIPIPMYIYGSTYMEVFDPTGVLPYRFSKCSFSFSKWEIHVFKLDLTFLNRYLSVGNGFKLFWDWSSLWIRA